MKKLLLTVLAVGGIFTACEKDEFEALGNQLDGIEAQVASNSGAINALQASLNEAVASLEAADADNAEALAAAEASIMESIDGLLGDIEDNTEGIAALLEQLNDLQETSASYDEATGILTIKFADGDEYSTGDLRGPRGARGPAGARGPQGPAGADGATGAAGADGEGADIDTTTGDWGPAFATQISDFDQTATLSANVNGITISDTISRTVEVRSTTATSTVASGTAVIELLYNNAVIADVAAIEAAVLAANVTDTDQSSFSYSYVRRSTQAQVTGSVTTYQGYVDNVAVDGYSHQVIGNSVAGADVVNNETINGSVANPNYVGPVVNAADVWAVTGTSGGVDENIRNNGAASFEYS